MFARPMIDRTLVVVRHLRTHGVFSTLKLIRRKLYATFSGSTSGDRLSNHLARGSKTDILGFYNFVRSKNIDCDLKVAVEHQSINWFIPPFGEGSGGHHNIFRFVRMMETRGFECNIVIVGYAGPDSASQIKEKVDRWFTEINAPVFIGSDSAPDAYFTFATSWPTAYELRNFGRTRKKLYFVQDFEPYFYSLGSEYVFAENTYRFGFTGVTAGDWLSDKLRDEYQMECISLGFSVDLTHYRILERREPEIKRVFFYARPPTYRRAFELGLLVLDELVRQLPHVKIIFAGWDVSQYEISFEHLNELG